MEINGQYLTYEEYKALGGTLDIMPFNLLEFEARRKIDIRTFNRLKDKKEIPQEVKLCIFNMVNSINSYATSLTNVGNVASESTDGYSVSYLTAGDISNVVKSKENELDDIIRTYLLGVIVDDEHLMYCGVE
jgi:hypothetical protein